MAATDIILNGVLGMESLLDNPSFVWKGETFACVPNTLVDQIKSADAGFNENADFRMTVRLNQFTPNIYPAINDYITYKGYQLLIKQIRKTSHNVFWVYVCELPSI